MKTATNDVMKIEIERQLEEAEREIREEKELVKECERQVSEYEESLTKLRKSGCQNLYNYYCTCIPNIKHGIIITHTHRMSLWLMTEI